ncbi:hypothetical protein GCM10009665_56020 [Kitasatospora nipponensis]|uniref:Knr4/Smi1-like domain-containing protein n=1 Tax=Kitasatospora nipponensis TaxID=258049 RepID=A0ABN1WPJ2_9ACTN
MREGAVGHFEGFDVAGFWDDSAYALEEYVEQAPPSRELIAALEEELGGYRLPDSYVALMTAHNGGTPTRTCFPVPEATSWAEDHVEITGIRGIGRTRSQSLGGEFGSLFWIDLWEYPDIGVYFADTPSAGHDMLALDYRACGRHGEPTVVHVDQENDFAITPVAENFEAFVTGLVDESVYDTSEQDRLAELAMVREGSFSPILLRAFREVADVLPDADRRLRTLAEAVVHDKGLFALHADARSTLMYDYLFWLFTSFNQVRSFEQYVRTPPHHERSSKPPNYALMIVGFSPASEPYGFRTGGCARACLDEWWSSRIASGRIAETADGHRFTDAAVAALLDELATVAGEGASAVGENRRGTETGVVQVFLSRGRFSSVEDIRDHVDERWSQNGDAEPSVFMAEVGMAELEPMCVEAMHARDEGNLVPVAPRVLLRGASYADQWLPQVESTEPADAAICVFAPNVVTDPHGSSLHYLGRFTYRV